MDPLRRICSRQRLGLGRPLFFSLLVVAPVSGAAQSSGDSSAALTGVREFASACRHDAGRTWGRSLCGPLVTVDGETGLAVATEEPPAGHFNRNGALWIGRVPDGMQVANTAMDWSGRVWSTVRLPLPADQFTRIRLLVHEAFHRIQPDLGLNARDALNPHLDDRDGRYLLRLELRAMAAAIQARGAAARRAARDALIFRAARNQRYPGSDTLETMLEIREGLPEYTGTRLALEATRLPVSRVAAATTDFEGRPTYVRSLGYGTGPLIGLLLDRYAPGWRTQLRERGFSRQLATAIGFVAPSDLPAQVTLIAPRYGGDSLARSEDERAVTRARAAEGYRARLLDGPVVLLPALHLMRGFDPNNLFPLDSNGTVYPTGNFEDEWGTLAVEQNGALVGPGNRDIRIAVPRAIDTTAAVIAGEGWRLELAEGWRLRPGPRPGDFTVKREGS
jgi:hypothetical protein